MSGKVVFVIVACAAWVAAVQSFHLDSADLGDLTLERTKRDSTMPKHWQEKYACCEGVPLLIKNESKVGCFPSTSPTPPPGDYPCWAECSFRKQILLTSANKLDMNAIAARVAQMEAANSYWATLLKAAYNTCKGVTFNIPAAQQCKSGAAEFKHCFNGQLFSNCPAAKRNPSAHCAEVLSRAGIQRYG